MDNPNHLLSFIRKFLFMLNIVLFAWLCPFRQFCFGIFNNDKDSVSIEGHTPMF